MRQMECGSIFFSIFLYFLPCCLSTWCVTSILTYQNLLSCHQLVFCLLLLRTDSRAFQLQLGLCDQHKDEGGQVTSAAVSKQTKGSRVNRTMTGKVYVSFPYQWSGKLFGISKENKIRSSCALPCICCYRTHRSWVEAWFIMSGPESTHKLNELNNISSEVLVTLWCF